MQKLTIVALLAAGLMVAAPVGAELPPPSAAQKAAAAAKAAKAKEAAAKEKAALSAAEDRAVANYKQNH